MQLPLILERRPSVTLAAVLFLIFGLAIAVVAVLPIPLWSCVVGTAVLLAALYRELRSAMLQGKGAVRGLRLLADGGLELRFRSGEWTRCEVRQSASLVTRWLVTVHLEGGGQRRVLVVPCDGMTAEQHRRLRVWLRWCLKPEKHAAGPTPQQDA